MATKGQRLAEREKQQREKALELRRKNYKTPVWNSERERPEVDPTIWDDRETNDRLATYIDWHARHPHQVTPRARGEVLVTAGKDIQIASPRSQVELMRGEDRNEAQLAREKVYALSPPRDMEPDKTKDEDDMLLGAAAGAGAGSSGGKKGTNVVSPDKDKDKDKDKNKDDLPHGDPMAGASFIRPKMKDLDELVHYSNGMSENTLSPEFKAPKLGANGRISAVTKLAVNFQTQAVNIARFDSGDVWYTTSVKDGLETYHIDGDHTSVRLKPPKARQKSAEQLAFEADMKWKEEQYGRYKGGGPSLSMEQQVILEKLAINVPTDKEKKDKVGPWEDPHKWSKYTEEGTLLDDFNAVDLERKIKEALVTHEELIEADKKRRAKLKRERLLAKKATRDRNAAFGLSAPPSRPTSSQVHPMAMGRVPEADEESISLMSQDMDNATFDGSAVTAGSPGGGMSLLGGDMASQGSPGHTLMAGESVGSGSTYHHKGHGQPSVGPLSIGTGASQAPPFRSGMGVAVPGSVIDQALDYVGFQEGEADGTTIDGSLAGQSSVSNLEGVGGSSLALSIEESKDGAGSLGGDAGSLGSPSVMTAPSTIAPRGGAESQADKKKRKMNNVLAAKGLSGPSSSASSSASSKGSLFSFLPAIPDMGIMARIRGKRKEQDDEEDGSKKKKSRKKESKENVDVADGEDGSKKKKSRKKESKENVDVADGDEDGLDDISDDSSEDDNPALKDKYDIMREQLGGDEKLEQAGDEWLKFAAYVRRKAKRDTNMFDTSLDLPDAVDKSNLSKTVFMLAINGADPNMKANNEEPLVINVVNKILLQDNVTGSLETEEDETTDRVRAFRVLQALVRYKVELNTTEAKNGVPPLHLAVAAGNFKMIRYLIEAGADPNYFSNDDTTPLMNAAKYGHIGLMAYLMRHQALLRVKDKEGRNVLHHAGKWGQTRSALFLLRCGLDKRIKDNEKLTAGALAEREEHIVTAQAIMTFSVSPYRAQFALQYFIDQKAKENEPKSGLEGASEAIGDALSSGAKAMGNAIGSAYKAVGSAVSKAGSALAGLFGFKREEKPSLDAFDA